MSRLRHGGRDGRVFCASASPLPAVNPSPARSSSSGLWPDDPEPSRLGARLSVQLSTVRRILGGGVIADRDAVRLDPDTASIDLAQFQAAIAAGRLREAVAMYRGPFLPEDLYEPWAEAPRDRSRASYAAALSSLATDAADRRDHDAVIELAQRLLEADPYNSDAHRRLIEALDRSGHHGAAQQARDRYSHHMHELGITEP